ncbi:MAG: flagellar hook-basal body complex protein, partial [Firmicutes bacterium]|nr:flagellar hook-basal body complex protein [Bacillota bacterium]
AGLTNIGNNLWQASANSGTSQVGVPNTGQLGSVASGQLEESNVNLDGEFVNLIVAQQGYEANAKVVTVDQTLAQTLTNAVQ